MKNAYLLVRHTDGGYQFYRGKWSRQREEPAEVHLLVLQHVPLLACYEIPAEVVDGIIGEIGWAEPKHCIYISIAADDSLTFTSHSTNRWPLTDTFSYSLRAAQFRIPCADLMRRESQRT